MSDLNNVKSNFNEGILNNLQNAINILILKAQGFRKTSSLNNTLSHEDHIKASRFKAAEDFLLNIVANLQDIKKILIHPESIKALTEALATLKNLKHQVLTAELPALTSATPAQTSSVLFFKTSEPPLKKLLDGVIRTIEHQLTPTPQPVDNARYPQPSTPHI